MEVKQPDKNKLSKSRKHLYKKAAAIALASMGAAYGGGDVAWSHFNQSGKYYYWAGKCAEPPHGGTIKAMTWNMKQMQSHQKKKLNTLTSLIAKERPDFTAVQEVTYPAARAIFRHLSDECFSMVYVKADTEQHSNIGDLGDAIITKQKPVDYRAESLPGTSYDDTLARWAGGIWHGITHSSDEDAWSQFNAAWQENRAAEAVTIKAYVDNELVEVRDVNTHITSPQNDDVLHDDQFARVMKLADSDTADNVSDIITGDFNCNTKAADVFFKKSDFTPFITGPTSPSAGEAIDHIAYRNNKNHNLGGGYAYVLKEKVSDHSAVIAVMGLGHVTKQPDPDAGKKSTV